MEPLRDHHHVRHAGRAPRGQRLLAALQRQAVVPPPFRRLGEEHEHQRQRVVVVDAARDREALDAAPLEGLDVAFDAGEEALRRDGDRLGAARAVGARLLERLAGGALGVVVRMGPDVGVAGERQVGRAVGRGRCLGRRPAEGVGRLAEAAHEQGRAREHALDVPPALRRGATAGTVGDRERRAAVRDDGVVRVGVEGLLGRVHVVAERPLPVLGAAEVVGEGLVVLGQPVGVQLLDGGADQPVQLAASLQEDALVRDVVDQRVLEHVRQLGVVGLLVDELQAPQLAHQPRHPVAHLGRALEQAQRELAADHGGDLDRALGVVAQPVDARREDALDAVRHRDRPRGRPPGRSRPFSRLSVPPSRSDFVTSSTKNGLPSALRAISW